MPHRLPSIRLSLLIALTSLLPLASSSVYLYNKHNVAYLRVSHCRTNGFTFWHKQTDVTVNVLKSLRSA